MLTRACIDFMNVVSDLETSFKYYVDYFWLIALAIFPNSSMIDAAIFNCTSKFASKELCQCVNQHTYEAQNSTLYLL